MASSRDEAAPAVATLLGALAAVVHWLNEAKVDFAVIGGLAASLHGKPRVTKDVDLVAIADNDSWGDLLAAATRWGLKPRIESPLEFAATTRVLLLVHEPSQVEVDLSFGMLPFEQELVARAEQRNVKNVRFPLASAEDIIVMKALALRPRDIADIEGIVASTPDLDLDRVRRVVTQLSAALETVDHRAELEKILRSV
jgi:predicted nucleotidyltransferase